ncbi:MAG: preprotein translocase subunit TatA [Bacillus thermozeamaize]|uniref:Sec-independent protein translocase protein TatA n=1 Tax=Bacillus thermozeamaize TaxID=230954 RepID=A0A1Y3PEK0_9BACI|nr:MAG: preprotein translocase subunit TatA [Bacillus thermozeamaize]
MNSIGLSGLVLILIVALLVFGPSKLPELGRAFGKTLREFKNATQGLVDDEDSDMKEKRKDVK